MLRWPLAEALIAFEQRVQARDLEALRFEQLMYAIGGQKRRPRVPRSLRHLEGGSGR